MAHMAEILVTFRFVRLDHYVKKWEVVEFIIIVLSSIILDSSLPFVIQTWMYHSLTAVQSLVPHHENAVKIIANYYGIT